jgi:Uma2 family endonuclease
MADMRKSATTRTRMTIAEFLEWDSGDDRHYELLDGVPTAINEFHDDGPSAMAPPSTAHAILAANFAHGLVEVLRSRRPCVALTPAGIPSPSASDTWYEADLGVSCQPEGRGNQIVAPIVIVEILSPSTENHDRKRKLPEYRAIPSVMEIVLIDSTRLYCEVHRRIEGDRWLTDLLLRRDARLRLDSIGFDRPLADLYEETGLDEATPNGANTRRRSAKPKRSGRKKN